MDVRSRSIGIKGQRKLFDEIIFYPSTFRYHPGVPRMTGTTLAML